MRTLCPNLDREDGLETVLEVPIPEEMFPCTKQRWQWQNQMKSWMIKPTAGPFRIGGRGGGGGGSGGGSNNNSPDRNSHIQLLLGVIGSPLIPLPATSSTASSPLSLASYRHRTHEIKDNPIEASMAKYIIQQYVAAMGGSHALNSIESMYAMGKVKMTASEFSSGEVVVNKVKTVTKNGNYNNNNGEIGGFVLWQKRPDLWSLELVVSGCKISAGSDGKVAWRQTPWHHSHASRGPARPLRRSLQGLDPRLTASLFTNAVCIGEKSINNEDCFILRVEAAHSTLHARSSSNVEIIRHTVWGYFSQRTGLLIQLEDTHLLRIKPLSAPKSTDQSIFWETTMESSITDYKTIDGVNIAHGGKTAVSLYRYADEAESSSRTRMEEVWSIVEVDFNIKGLEVECFLPPSDLKREDEEDGEEVEYDDDDSTRNGMNLVGANVINPLKKTVVPSPPPVPIKALPSMMLKPRGPPPKISLAKIMAIDDDDLEMYGGRKDDSSAAADDQSKER